MKMKIILIIVLLLSLVVGLYYYISKEEKESLEPKNYTIEFQNKESQLYFYANMWGVSGGHYNIILSSTPFNENDQVSSHYDEMKDYIYYTTELYYKKKGEDTLVIYAPESSMPNSYPTKFGSSIVIEQIGLKNAGEIKDYESNFKDYGLSRISVYDK